MSRSWTVKLSDIMTAHGWVQCNVDEKFPHLKVYQKDNLLFGVQKFGDVFRLDIQMLLNLGGMMLPGDKMLHKEIVPINSLEPALHQLLPQLA